MRLAPDDKHRTVWWHHRGGRVMGSLLMRLALVVQWVRAAAGDVTAEIPEGSAA